MRAPDAACLRRLSLPGVLALAVLCFAAARAVRPIRDEFVEYRDQYPVEMFSKSAEERVRIMLRPGAPIVDMLREHVRGADTVYFVARELPDVGTFLQMMRALLFPLAIVPVLDFGPDWVPPAAEGRRFVLDVDARVEFPWEERFTLVDEYGVGEHRAFRLWRVEEEP